MRTDWEVVIVGGGPSGCRAAIALAGAGIETCVFDPRVTVRCEAAGELVGREVVQLLKAVGIDASQVGSPIRSVRIMQGPRTDPIILSGPSMQELFLLPRGLLERSLVERAQEAGATFMDSTVRRWVPREDGIDVEAGDGATVQRFSARYVVLAVGAKGGEDHAGARFPSTSLGSIDPSSPTAFACSAWVAGIDDQDDALDVFPPQLNDAAEPMIVWSWFAPMGDGTGTLHTGVVGSGVTPELARQRLFSAFEDLVANMDRYRRAELRGGLRSGQMGCGYSSAADVLPGVLAVGDAAGLCSPFLGEGVGFSLESAALAAEAIVAALAGRVDEPAKEYAEALASRFVGYFEAGRQALRRYRLASRVVAATMDDETPLFQVMRRTVVTPSTVSYPPRLVAETTRLQGVLGTRGPVVEAAMRRVDDLLLRSLRFEWPYLADLAMVARRERSLVLRPSLVAVVIGILLEGDVDHLVEAASAADFGALTALAALSVEDRPVRTRGGVDWANIIATLCVEFCAVQALAAARQAGPAIDHAVREAVTGLVQTRLVDLSTEAPPKSDADPQEPSRSRDWWEPTEVGRTPSFAELLYCQFVAVPTMIGALAAGAPSRQVDDLAPWGAAVARAARAVDELRLLSGAKSRFGLDMARSAARGMVPRVFASAGTASRWDARLHQDVQTHMAIASGVAARYPAETQLVLSHLGEALVAAQGYGAFEGVPAATVGHHSGGVHW